MARRDGLNLSKPESNTHMLLVMNLVVAVTNGGYTL
jgi:hypothetical protein